MVKDALTEYARSVILRQEANADNQGTVHFKRVEQAVSYAFDFLVSQIPMSEEGKYEIESYYVKHYYNQPLNENSGYRYVGVSDSIIPVGEGRGIWYVQPSGGGKPFSMSKRPSTAMFRNMQVGGVMNETFWRLGNLATNPQIILENIGDSPFVDIRTVDYGIVRGYDSYEGTEEVKVPGGRIDLLMQLVMSWHNGVYNDNVNNNA